MLSFTSLLIVCLVLSAVVYFIYKIVTDSSRSVYRSKQPLALSDREDHLKKGYEYPKGKSAAFGKIGEVASPNDFARTYPAMPAAGSVNWKWEGAGVQLREVQSPHPKTANNPGHCSLYDVKSEQPAAKPNPYNGRLHRAETERPAGRTYKVTRKTQRSFDDNDGDMSKPWGW